MPLAHVIDALPLESPLLLIERKPSGGNRIVIFIIIMRRKKNETPEAPTDIVDKGGFVGTGSAKKRQRKSAQRRFLRREKEKDLDRARCKGCSQFEQKVFPKDSSVKVGSCFI